MEWGFAFQYFVYRRNYAIRHIYDTVPFALNLIKFEIIPFYSRSNVYFFLFSFYYKSDYIIKRIVFKNLGMLIYCSQYSCIQIFCIMLIVDDFNGLLFDETNSIYLTPLIRFVFLTFGHSASSRFHFTFSLHVKIAFHSAK